MTTTNSGIPEGFPKIALISVYNKTGIDVFSRSLIELGWQIVSSGGTATFLKESGIPVTDTADLTGLKAMLSHRVATLHPAIHGGLLALDTPEHLKEMDENKIPWIGMVCCDFYPLEEEIAKPESTRESVIEKTDIGGPTMVRSGAKGRRVTICHVDDRASVIEWLKNGEPDRQIFLDNLAAKAEFIISRYCAISASYTSNGKYKGLFTEQVAECAYGENAYQKPAYLSKNVESNDSLALHNWKHVAGNSPSYNNWCDIDRMMQIVTHIGAGFEKNFNSVPYVAVGVKHGNACGASVSDSPKEAISKMLQGDLRAIFGGSVMVNFPIDEALADALIHDHMPDGARRLLDVVTAPSFTDEAIEILSRKKGKCRLVVNLAIEKAGFSSLDTVDRFRYVRGGFLQQPNYTFVLDFSDPLFTVAQGEISEQNKTDILLGWAVGATSNSNTITITKNGRLLGNGVGQQDRVGAGKLAVSRATDAMELVGVKNLSEYLNDSVAYSDSFFPFPDGPEYLIQNGIRTIFSTSGSVNDGLIIDLCRENKVSLCMVPDVSGRGFFNH